MLSDFAYKRKNQMSRYFITLILSTFFSYSVVSQSMHNAVTIEIETDSVTDLRFFKFATLYFQNNLRDTVTLKNYKRNEIFDFSKVKKNKFVDYFYSDNNNFNTIVLPPLGRDTIEIYWDIYDKATLEADTFELQVNYIGSLQIRNKKVLLEAFGGIATTPPHMTIRLRKIPETPEFVKYQSIRQFEHSSRDKTQEIITKYEEYLKEFPEGDMELKVRYYLALTRLSAGNSFSNESENLKRLLVLNSFEENEYLFAFLLYNHYLELNPKSGDKIFLEQMKAIKHESLGKELIKAISSMTSNIYENKLKYK